MYFDELLYITIYLIMRELFSVQLVASTYLIQSSYGEIEEEYF
jgi:hypothetical protein